ncbi:Uncharacterized protein GBIM_15866 [Gryllus bimaculatus]|nr:Uncharacterized protein GBIM_15866 [Gryllus bimaculatus]
MDTANGTVSTAPCATPLPSACVAFSDLEKRRLPSLACPAGYSASRFHSEGGGDALHCFRADRSDAPLAFEDAMREHGCVLGPRAGPLASALARYVVPKVADRLRLEDGETCWSNFNLSDPQKDIRLETVSNASALQASLRQPEYPVVVLSEDGDIAWFTTSHPQRCSLCEVQATVPEVDMYLARDRQRRKLLLNVYGASGLWYESNRHFGFRCFTNARGGYRREVDVKRAWSGHWTLDNLEDFLSSGETGRRHVFDLDMEKTIYEVEYEKKSAGRYWCEGHVVGTFRKVRSNTVLVRGITPGHVYSLGIDIESGCTYDSTDCDPTFHENFEKIGKKISKKMPDSLIADVRFMRILNVTDNGTVSIILHVVPDFIEHNAADDFERIRSIVKKYLEDVGPPYHFRSLLSTEGCVPLSASNGYMNLTWKFTPLGAVGVPEELCLQADGTPVSRPCQGDFVTGGQWGPVSGNCSHRSISEVTSSLHEIATRAVVGIEGHSIAENVSALTSNPDILTPADVYYTARTMRNLASSRAYERPMTKADATNELKSVSDIVNHISLANDKSVIISQKVLNSSNMLLDAVDVLFDRISSRINDDDNEDDVLLAVTPYVLIQVCDIRKTNVTGLALIRRDVDDSGEPPTDFTKYEVVPLESTERLESVLQYNDLEVAVWAPHNLVDFVFNSTGNGTWYDPQPGVSQNTSTAAQSRIVISLFYKDLTFYNSTEELPQGEGENGTRTTNETVQDLTKVGSRIVSVSIPGFSRSLPVPIPIIFRPLVDKVQSRQCAYWDFTYNSSTSSSSTGGWSSEGCIYAGNSTLDASSGQLDVCLCTHLTHFAELLGSRYSRLALSQQTTYEDVITMEAHIKVLDAITLMGCCLSLFGIAGIIVTAVAFRTWRQKPGSKILLQLSAALAFQIVLLMVSGTLHTAKDEAKECHLQIDAVTKETTSNSCLATPPKPDTVCIVLGALLHYFSLSAFTWMFVTALLQFTRYVKILGPSRPPRFFLKSFIFGWGAPLVPVVLLVSISPNSYVQPALCYPSGLGLYLAVLIPILIFLSMNLSVFVMVINSIVRGPDGKVRSNPERKLVISQLKLSVLLFFLLGLSWLFGLLVVSGAGIIFSYLFCIAATLQGFVMFIFFVACDPATRKLWQATFGSWSNLVLLKLGPTESSADLTSSVSTIHRESNTETSDAM